MDDTEVTKSDTPTWIKSRVGSSEKFREILLNLELNEIFIPKIPWLAVGRTGKIFYNGKCLKRIGDGQQGPVHGSVVSIERGYPRGLDTRGKVIFLYHNGKKRTQLGKTMKTTLQEWAVFCTHHILQTSLQWITIFSGYWQTKKVTEYLTMKRSSKRGWTNSLTSTVMVTLRGIRRLVERW